MVKSLFGSASPSLKAPAPKSDPVANSLRRKIDAVKEQLQNLEKDENLSPDKKREMRQKLEAQLAELSNQLQQHEIRKREQEAKAQAEAIKKQSERYEQEKPPEEQAKDAQRELSYGFALSESHLYSAKAAESAFIAAKGQNALADVQAKSYNGSSVSPETVAGADSAMDKAMQFRGESARKATGAMERMNERLGDLSRAASKSEREEEAEASNASEEANGAEGVQGASVSQDGAVQGAAVPGAKRIDGDSKDENGGKSRENEEERRKKRIDIFL